MGFNIMDDITRKTIKNLRKLLKTYQKAGDVQTVIRIKAIIAHLSLNSIESIASCLDVSEKTIRRWIKIYTTEGDEGFPDKPRSGRPPKLNSDELNQLREIIVADQQRVWVARHIYVLIVQVFAVVYSVKYLPELLKKIDLSFHKAVHYLVKRNEEKRSQWIKERLPKIYEEHIQSGWRIFYQDEVGFQTEGTLSYSWGPRGEKIETPNYGRHGRVNLMGAYEVGTGEFFYKMTCFKVTALRFKRFICSLKRQFKTDKIILIADNASFHKAKWFTQWWQSKNWLKIEFLPAYSPDFNPIERLWKWIKKEYTHNQCWKSKADLKSHLEKKLSEMITNKSAYMGTMRKEMERLKSAFDFYGVEFLWGKVAP